jgi:hypothetical protein
MALVVLGIYGSLTEAELIKSRLVAAGVESMVSPDMGSSTIPTLAGSAGVRVLVRESDLAEAYEILERMLPAGTSPPATARDEPPHGAAAAGDPGWSTSGQERDDPR